MATGAALFVHQAGNTVTLNCADATGIYSGGQPSTVTLLPLDKVTTKTTDTKSAKSGPSAAHGPTAR
jgi:hypothetical protein